MTDPTDQTDPTVPGGTDQTGSDADSAWFRAQVDPVVHAPAPDAWPQIAERSTASDPAVLSPAGADGRRPGRWLVAAAAAVALLVGGIAVVSSGDGDSTSVEAGQPKAPGWYVPMHLPDGWTLENAWITEGGLCTSVLHGWSSGDQPPTPGATIEMTYDGCGDGTLAERAAPGTPTPGPPLAGLAAPTTIAAASSDPDDAGQRMIRWGDEPRWTVRTEGLGLQQLIDAATAIVAFPGSADPPLPGFDTTSVSHIPAMADGAVVVEMRTPTDDLISFRLTPPGGEVTDGPFATVEVHPIEGQPNPVSLIRSVAWKWLESAASRPDQPCCFPGDRYHGAWPEADVDAPRWLLKDDRSAAGRPTAEDLATHDALIETLLGSLRLATTDSWRSFLATSANPVEPALLDAETLADVAAPTGPTEAATTTPEAAEPAEGDESTTTTTIASSDPDPERDTLESEPATVVPVADREGRDLYSDLEGLSVRLRLRSGTIGIHEPTPADLLITNTTDRTISINECSEALMQWGIVPEEQNKDLPGRVIADCFDTARTTVGAGTTAIVPLEAGLDHGFTARVLSDEPNGTGRSAFLGTLPGGRYTAVVVIPGSTGDIRISLPVRIDPPACPMSDEESSRYRELDLETAIAAAARDGRVLAPVEVDGERGGTGWNLDCSRMRTTIANDTVVDYTFG